MTLIKGRPHQAGDMLNTEFGPVKFASDAVAEVTDEQASFLLTLGYTEFSGERSPDVMFASADEAAQRKLVKSRNKLVSTTLVGLRGKSHSYAKDEDLHGTLQFDLDGVAPCTSAELDYLTTLPHFQEHTTPQRIEADPSPMVDRRITGEKVHVIRTTHAHLKSTDTPFGKVNFEPDGLAGVTQDQANYLTGSGIPGFEYLCGPDDELAERPEPPVDNTPKRNEWPFNVNATKPVNTNPADADKRLAQAPNKRVAEPDVNVETEKKKPGRPAKAHAIPPSGNEPEQITAKAQDEFPAESDLLIRKDLDGNETDEFPGLRALMSADEQRNAV